jgi:hypothetical protein
MSPIPKIGKDLWEELAPANDVSLPASFAHREACTMEDIQQQLSASCSNQFDPYLSITEGSDKKALQVRDWYKTLAKLSRPSLEANFLTAAERYERLEKFPVGGFLAPLKLVNKEGGWTRMVLIPVGPPATQLQGSPPANQECLAETDGKWQPCDHDPPSSPFRPMLTTTWTTSRASTPGGIRSDFYKHATSHLLIIKGTNFLRPILTHAVSAECPFPNDDMRKLWVCDKNDFAAMPANEDQPKHIIDTASKPTTFWFMSAALPLPTNHNLPLGVPIDPSTIESSFELVEILRGFMSLPDSSEEYDWLVNAYVDAWLYCCRTAPDFVACKALSLAQVLTTWTTVVDHNDPASIPVLVQSTFPHMECQLLHIIRRDQLQAKSSPKWWTSYIQFEKVSTMIFGRPISIDKDLTDEDSQVSDSDSEDYTPPLGYYPMPLQAYMYLLMIPSVKEWNTGRGFKAFRQSLKPPAFVTSFSTLETPKAISLVPSTLTLTMRTTEELDQITQQSVDEDSESAAANKLLDGFFKDYKTPTKSPSVQGRSARQGPPTQKLADKASTIKQKLFQDSSRSHQVVTIPDSDSRRVTIKLPNIREEVFDPSFEADTSNIEDTAWKLPVQVMQDRMAYSQNILQPDWTHYLTGQFSPNRDVKTIFDLSRMRDGDSTHRSVISLAHFGAHRLPTQALMYPIGSENRDKRWASKFLTLPGQISGKWVTNILTAEVKTIHQVGANYLRTRLRLARNYPLPGTPKFSDQFFRLDAILKPLQAGQFSDGLAPLSTTADIDSALTPWHFISSVTTPDQGSIRLPPAGLNNAQATQLTANMIALFHEIFHDDTLYPNLPQGHSPFSLRGPFCGALCSALRVLQDPMVIASWDDLVSQQKGVKLSTLFLSSLCHLWRILLDWSLTEPVSKHAFAASPANDRSRTDITLLGPYLMNGIDTLDALLTVWCSTFARTFRSSTMDLDSTSGLWTSIALPTVCAPSNTSNKRAIDIPSRSTPQVQSDRPLKHPKNAGNQQPTQNRAPVQNFSRKYLRNPLLELVDRAAADPAVLGRQLSQARQSDGIDIPRISEKPICFSFLTSAGCPGSMTAKYNRKVPCNRVHADIDSEPGKWSKEKLQQLYDYAKDPRTKTIFRPSAHFKTFMS